MKFWMGVCLACSAGLGYPGHDPAPAVRSTPSRSVAELASTPVLGFVPGSPANELRAVLGIPGALRLSRPVVLPAAVTRIHLAPRHGYALVEQNAPAGVGMVVLGPELYDAMAVTPLDGAPATLDVLAFSPTGRAAVLYSRAEGRFAVYTGLPDAPRLARDVPGDLAAGLPQRLAISDDGRALVVADEQGWVSVLPPGSGAVALYHGSDPAALTFIPESDDLILAERGSPGLVWLRGVTGNLAVLRLPDGGEGMEGSEALAVTSDRRYVLAANSSRQRISRMDLESGLVATAELPVSPRTLDLTRGPSTYLISSSDGEPGWLFTWDGSTAAGVFFVPRDPGPQDAWRQE